MGVEQYTGFYSNYSGLTKLRINPLRPDPKAALYMAGKVTEPFTVDYGIPKETISNISMTESEYIYGSTTPLIGEDDKQFINYTMLSISEEGEIDNGF
jgi:hypothetical protein